MVGASAQPSAVSESRARKILKSMPAVITAVGAALAAVSGLLSAINDATWLRKEATPTAAIAVVATTVRGLRPTLTGQPLTSIAAQESEATALPTPSSNGVLLLEPFGPESGWENDTGEGWQLGTFDGAYRIIVDVPLLSAWANPPGDHRFADLVAQVDVRQSSGDPNSYVGLVIREQADSNFYLFAASGDGWFAVQKSIGDNWEDLAPWTQHEAIHETGDSNTLRVECLGPRLRFLVNDVLMTELDDDSYESGEVGLLAGTSEDGGIEARFDNLRVQVLQRFGQ